jgi:hypothetical protein
MSTPLWLFLLMVGSVPAAMLLWLAHEDRPRLVGALSGRRARP